MSNAPKKLLDQLRDALRIKHYAYRTEQTYVDWVHRFIVFHNKRHPKDMDAREVEAFLTHLATERKVAASTQNQALSALLLLYRYVLRQEIDLSIDAVRVKKSRYLPTVQPMTEAINVLDHLSRTYQLVAKIFYGSGLHLSEAIQLRVKDIDFAHQQIVVKTTMIYTHVLNKGGRAVLSPLDACA